MDYTKLQKNLCNFIKNKSKNSNGVVFGLSGGIDSALIATLCKISLNDKVLALLMPTKFSNKTNLDDALRLCEKLNLDYKIIYIDEILDSFIKTTQNITKLRIGNLSARIRMSLLYDYSALMGYLVVGTSNKSEIKLGYGTIYGDLACAFNPIGDIYKSDIFKFAKFLKIDDNFINKAPSADLWEGQSDESDLGFSYEKIDEVLKAIEDNKNLNIFDKNLVDMVINRLKNNAFKQKMPEIFYLKDIK